MGNKIGGKIVLEGEAEYRKALTNINSEQRALRSEMKLCTSEFSGQQNSITALTRKGEILSKQYDTQAKKLDIYSKAVEDSAKRQEEAGRKVDELRDELEKANSRMEEMASSADTSSEALEEQQRIIESLKNKLALAEDSYSRAQTATNNWQTSLNEAEVRLNDLSNEIQDNNRCLDEARDSADGCADSIDEYGREVQEAQEQTSVFADVLKAELVGDAIKKGISAITDGLKTAVTSAVSMGSSFEASMSQVAATMGITSQEIEAGSAAYETLENAAKECGKSTKFSASQAAEALNYLALAGYDANKAAQTLPAVLNLAAAGGMELAAASDLVTDSMAALGMETSELDNYIDEMAKASQKSNTSVAQLGEATLVCAGTVSMTGQSIETMNAELGVLANNGVKSAEGGTHLRNILLSLAAPTDTASAALKELGVRVSDSSGNMRDLNDIMIDLNAALDGMSDTQKSGIINKIFNRTDIASVNYLLKGTGMEFDNLKSELENCSGAAEEMANTMNDNLNGKVTILNSALEGLGITAYEKVEGMLKDSVDAATDSVGRLQDSMEDGELGRAVDNMADALGEAAAKAIGFGEDALPVLIDGLTWIIDNSDLIISGITGIAAAEIYHGTVAPMISAVTTAWNAYKTANEGATIAQWAMNTAMNANPAGLLVTAVVGVTAAVAAFIAISDDADAATQRLVDSTNRTIESINSNVAAREDNRLSNEAEIATIKQLKTELLDLNSKEKLSEEQKTRLKMVVDELNTAMPQLNLTIDEQTGYLEQSNEEIEKYIDNLQREMEIGFMQEDLEDIARDLWDAKVALNEVQAEYNANLEESQKIEEDWAAACNEGEAAMNEFNAALGERATDAMERFAEKNSELEQPLNDAQQLVDELQAEYDSMAETLKEATTPLGDMADATEELNEVMIEYNGTAYSVTSEVAANIDNLEQSYADALAEAEESIDGQIGLFKELSAESDLSVSQMAENLKSQTETMNTYSEDLQKAAELAEEGLLDEGLLGAISSLGLDGAGYLHELVTAAETDTQTFNEVMDEWAEMGDAKSNLIETLADMESGYSSSMDSILGIQQEKGKDLYDDMVETTDDLQDVAEETMEEMAKTTGEGIDTIAECVGEKTPEVRKASEELGEAAEQGAETALGVDSAGKSKSFTDIGYSIPQGLAAGIKKGQSLVNDAAAEMGTSAENATKKAIDAHSPSRKFKYLGEMSAEGYAEGICDRLDENSEAVHEAMDNVLDYDYEGLADAQADAAAGIGELTEAIEEQGDAASETKGFLAEFISGHIDIGNATDETVEKIQKLQETYQETKDAALESIDSQAGLFKKLEMESDVTTQDMIDSLSSQAAYFNTYGADLTAAVGLVEQGLLDEGLLGAIQKMGLDGAGYLHELVTAAQEDTASLDAIMGQWTLMNAAKENLSVTMANVQMLYGDGMEKVADILEDKGSDVEGQVSTTAKNTKKTVDDTLSDMVSGTSDGIDEVSETIARKTPDVQDASAELCSAAIEGAETTLGIDNTGAANKCVSIGYSIPQGIAEGIYDGQDIVTSAIQNVINNSINSVDFDGLASSIVSKIDKELGGLIG